MLPIKKIYVDSRFKSSDSASHSDFKIDLPQNFLMPEDTGFYIDDVCIPHSWYPVEDGRNAQLVVRYGAVVHYVAIDSGNYTATNLGVEIVDAINKQIATFLNAPGAQYLESKYSIKTSKLEIKLKDSANDVTFEIYTDAQLKTLFPADYPKDTLNALLKNLTAKSNTNTSPFVSGFIDMYPYRNVYMTSSGLGNFNTMSVAGDRNIIKKIPVNAGHGEVIFDQTITGMDYLDCSRQTLSRISFQLRDVYGNIINLNGNHISFSIVFSRVQDGS